MIEEIGLVAFGFILGVIAFMLATVRQKEPPSQVVTRDSADMIDLVNALEIIHAGLMCSGNRSGIGKEYEKAEESIVRSIRMRSVSCTIINEDKA